MKDDQGYKELKEEEFTKVKNEGISDLENTDSETERSI